MTREVFITLEKKFNVNITESDKYMINNERTNVAYRIATEIIVDRIWIVLLNFIPILFLCMLSLWCLFLVILPIYLLRLNWLKFINEIKITRDNYLKEVAFFLSREYDIDENDLLEFLLPDHD
jgi:hypothetical protein